MQTYNMCKNSKMCTTEEPSVDLELVRNDELVNLEQTTVDRDHSCNEKQHSPFTNIAPLKMPVHSSELDLHDPP